MKLNNAAESQIEGNMKVVFIENFVDPIIHHFFNDFIESG